MRQRPPSEAGGGTLHRAVFRNCQKLLQIVLTSGVLPLARDPRSPGNQRGFGVLFLKVLFPKIKRDLCFLLREKPAVKTARLFLDSFYISLHFLEGGVSLGMLVSLCTEDDRPRRAGGPAPSLHLLGMGEAPCSKSSVCLYTVAWPQGAITVVNMASTSVPL